MSRDDSERRLNDQIAHLELQLANARNRLKNHTTISVTESSAEPQQFPNSNAVGCKKQTDAFGSHALLLLSDSALPLGSFAFSSGLESYLAHHPRRPAPSICPFLSHSLYSISSTSLPYLLAAHKNPTALTELDDTLDACTLCPVARRASVAQGSALLTLWERSFKDTIDSDLPAVTALADFGKELKAASNVDGETRNGHFAPLWAVVTAAMGIPIKESAYAFLLNHAKAVMSAAVRASMLGPYQAQSVLAGDWLQHELKACLDTNWEVPVEDAGQAVPVIDLWIGKHEMLYSRIFNS